MINSIVGRSSKSSTRSRPFSPDPSIHVVGQSPATETAPRRIRSMLEAVAEGEGRHTPIALDVLSVTGDEL